MVGFVLGIRLGCDCPCGDGAACADHSLSGRKSFGFVEYGLGGGDHGQFDGGNGIGAYAEFVHSAARFTRVVGFAENAVDAGNEGSGMFVGVLATGIGEECEFCDAGADVLACGCTGREACVRPGWVCGGEKNR